jgi:hypothetical protein
MRPMSCRVSFEDEHGSTHAVTVTASSLFEAVGLAVKAFAAQPWTPPVSPATPLIVVVSAPIAQHQVTVQKVRQWASGTARSPADRLQRERVRSLLATT